MTAIDVLRSRLGVATAGPPQRKIARPRTVALIDVHACTGCGLCVEICTHLAHVSAIRSYDTNLVEQALGCAIAADAPLARTSPEPGHEYWAEEGAFHHMGEGTRIPVADLSPEERTALAAGAR